MASFELCADLYTVHDWFLCNGLSLNPDKSEEIIMETRVRLRSDVPITSITVAGSSIPVVSSVKSLGVTLDSTLTFDQHVRNICKSSSYHIRALRHIRKCVNESAAKSIACTMVGARIDYCNALLYGISEANIDKLQRLQNSL